MQILDLPEMDLKKQLKKYALEYVKKYPYYKSKKIVIDFLISYLGLTTKSKEYPKLKKKIQNDLWLITRKLLKNGIITRHNNQFYKINKNIENFDGKLEIIANSINEKREKKERQKRKEIKSIIVPKPLIEKKENRGCKKKQLKITDDEIKELYNKNFGVPTISKIAGCSHGTIYDRLKGIEKIVYWRKQLKITDDKIKELYDKKFGISNICNLAGCSHGTIYSRLKDVKVNNSRIDEDDEDEFIEFLNRVYLKTK